jgi:peptidoglycan hydrolase-like protein with peptidoglycan-binding domain
MGPATIKAVRQAQQQLGITPDGFAGKVTFEALKKALELQA